MDIAEDRKVKGKELSIRLYVYFTTFILPCVRVRAHLLEATTYKVGTSLGIAPLPPVTLKLNRFSILCMTALLTSIKR